MASGISPVLVSNFWAEHARVSLPGIVAPLLVYEPVQLTQDYRQFDFMSPWEGAQYILPGDEKGDAR